ncbi:MAG: hypothetical protein C4522_20495 [Desulfobacteraceae bacterium]|nr:MAG: hypothetical protein C4522_20495 [Desulfobacteraceae bacterium]
MKKSLLCITTCKRLPVLKSILPDYIAFCNDNPAYDFLVSLDGEEKTYLDFFNKFDIPAIYSENQEGVGLSKNRVLKTFPDYDYYFFIDDDVELVDHSIFDIHINLSAKTGIHHFSSGETHQFFGNNKETQVENFTIIHSDFGSGAFNFFTAEGLKKVGGWHTEFAKYKRFGHTEHSYRFLTNGLAPSPFNFIINTGNHITVNHPDHVVDPDGYRTGDGGIAQVENEIIKKRLSYCPFNTLCRYHYNGKPLSLKIKNFHYIQTRGSQNILVKMQHNPFLSINEKYLLLEKEHSRLQSKNETLENQMEQIHQSISFKMIRRIVESVSHVNNWFSKKL